MLPRVLEKEVMDSEHEAQQYDDMDFAAVNALFVDQLLEFANSIESFDGELGDVMDLGTGTALIPIELCKRHEDCRVMAVDMAASMLDLAKFNVQVNLLDQRITLTQLDAKGLIFEDEMFDVSICNSLIHHLAQPELALSQIARVTREDGIIFVRDLLRPADESMLDHLVETYVSQESEYSQNMFRDSLHASLTLEEMREIVVELGFASDTVSATSDRHWTWAAQNSPMN